MTGDSQPGENKYGLNPKADLVAGTDPYAV